MDNPNTPIVYSVGLLTVPI